MILDPGSFDVLVAPNLYGDIIRSTERRRARSGGGG